jgi:hypothetical protein
VMEDARLRQMPDVPTITEAEIAPYPFGRMQLMYQPIRRPAQDH